MSMSDVVFDSDAELFRHFQHLFNGLACLDCRFLIHLYLRLLGEQTVVEFFKRVKFHVAAVIAGAGAVGRRCGDKKSCCRSFSASRAGCRFQWPQ